jgi:dipeptidyl aminopeptidase/acylaminoacyl peptidase
LPQTPILVSSVVEFEIMEEKMKITMTRTAYACLLTAVLLAAAMAAGAKEPFDIEDIFRLRWVSSPAISPGGRYVAYVVEEPADTLKDQKYGNPDIWVIDLEDRDHPRPFVFSDSRETSPAWSMDDMYLYFLSDRGEEDKIQVWRIAVSGGEAEQVSTLEGGAASFVLSPDCSKIAVTSARGETAAEKKASEDGKDWKVIGEDRRRRRLWIIDAGTGEGTPVTSEGFHVSSICWSPTGNAVAMITADASGSNEIYFNTRLEIIDLSDRGITIVTDNASGSPSWSHDGKRIAFIFRQRHEGMTLPAGVVAVINTDGSDLKLLGERHGGTLVNPVWMPEDDKLLVINLNGVRGELATLSVGDSKVEKIEELEIPYYLRRSFDIARDGSRIVFLKGSTKSPPEVWLWERGLFSGSDRLTRVHRWLEEKELPEAKVVRWKSRDGTEIEGVLWLPADFRKDGTFPAVVDVHGGPMWAWGYGWHGSWYEWAIPLASRGFVVLLPNPRGSIGYGPGFARANFDDWGGGDYEDVIAGADYLVSEGYASREKLGIGGWSYGGFMTSWAVTKTARFSAAVAGAAVTNLFSFHGTTDITPTFLEEYFRETAYLRPEAYRSHSPVEGVTGSRTPTLVLHGEDDIRVPVGQGYEFYNGLKQSGVECEMVVYPREGHTLREIHHKIDLIKRIIGWYELHLK